MKKLFSVALATLAMLPMAANARYRLDIDSMSDECQKLTESVVHSYEVFDDKANPWEAKVRAIVRFRNSDDLEEADRRYPLQKAAEVIISECEPVVEVWFAVANSDYIITYRAYMSPSTDDGVNYIVKQAECVNPIRGHNPTLPWSKVYCL